MTFKNRIDAGQKLAKALEKYQDSNPIIFGLTRGGVPVAQEVAKKLHAPLAPLIIRKIGHPTNPEYAVGAISSGGEIAVNETETSTLSPSWLQKESQKQKAEAERRVNLFIKNHPLKSLVGKTAIIVDDGIATGLTMQAAIKEIKKYQPTKLIIAAPVAPKDILETIKKEVDECVVLDVPIFFLGAVGSYYNDFSEVTDDNVLKILKQ